MEAQILIKTREDLIGRIEYFRTECAEAEAGLLLPDMLLNFYMYVCARAVRCSLDSGFMTESIDWEALLVTVDSAMQDDGIYERQGLDDLRSFVLEMRTAGWGDDDAVSVFSRWHWSQGDLTGRIHEQALKTIDFYAQLNVMGNPYASSELTLPVVLRIQHVMNETVFNVPMFAYWWAVYLVVVGEKVLREEYWKRDLSDPVELRKGLLELSRRLDDMEQSGDDLKTVADSIYDVPIPWDDALYPLKRGLECLEVFVAGN